MSDTEMYSDPLSPDPLYPTPPVTPPPTPKKKGSFLGTLLVLLLGFILGVVGTIGGVFFTAYSVPANDVAKLAGIDLNDYLEKEYAEQTILGMFGAVGSAVGKITNGKATLQDFDDISPKVGSAVEKLSSTISDNYGIGITSDGLLTTPFSELSGYLKDSILNSYVADLLSNALDVNDSTMLMGMCYGTKGIDYTIDGNGEVQMLNGATPRTINDLKEMGNGLFDDIPLADLMAIDHDSALMMYIAYGKKDTHYQLNAADEVVMLRQRIAVYESNAYNAYGELMSGTLNGTTSYTENEIKYMLVADPSLGTIQTKDGNTATLYYLNSADNSELYYHSTTLGDLMNDEDLIGNITTRLTIGEVLGEEATSDNKFLKHVSNVTIDNLSTAVEDLTVTQVFDTEVFKTNENKEFLDKNGVVTTNPDEYVLESEWWYLLHSEENTDCDGSHMDGVCGKSCVTDYKVMEMDALITNMRKNIEGASLFKLKKDGMIDTLDSSMLNQDVRYKIAGISFDDDLTLNGIPHGDGTKMGALTVEQMLKYVNVIFAKIPSELP